MSATICHTKVLHTRILKDLIPGPMNSIQLIYSMVLIAEYMYGYQGRALLYKTIAMYEWIEITI